MGVLLTTVVPAQKGAAHAAVDDVVPGRVGQRDQGGAGTGHGQEFKECCLFRQLKWVSFLLRDRKSVV